MFNVGGPEIVVVLLVALVVLGPDQLPKAMRTVGNVMGQVRKVSGGFQAEVRKAMDTLDAPAAGQAVEGSPPPVAPPSPAGREPAAREPVASDRAAG